MTTQNLTVEITSEPSFCVSFSMSWSQESLLCVQNVLHSNQPQMASIPGSSPRLCPSRVRDSMIYLNLTILLQLALAFAFGLVTLIFAILGGTKSICNYSFTFNHDGLRRVSH